MPVSDQPTVVGESSCIQIPEESSKDPDAVNPEMFIDTEFYQTLLNEYLVGHGMERVAIKVRS